MLELTKILEAETNESIKLRARLALSYGNGQKLLQRDDVIPHMEWNLQNRALTDIFHKYLTNAMFTVQNEL